jgi:hypothetical protein
MRAFDTEQKLFEVDFQRGEFRPLEKENPMPQRTTIKNIVKLAATAATKGAAGGSNYEPPVWARCESPVICP